MSDEAMGSGESAQSAPTTQTAMVNDHSTEVTPQGAVDASSGKAPMHGTWEYSDGVPGSGERPEYLKGHFKTVEDQAKAYGELQSHHDRTLAGFKGAPENGYEYEVPVDYKDKGYHGPDFNTPDGQEFLQMCAEHKMSQECLNDVVDTMVEQRAMEVEENQAMFDDFHSQYIEMEAEKLGPDAARIAEGVAYKLGQIPGVSPELAEAAMDGMNNAAVIALIDKLTEHRNYNTIPQSAQAPEPPSANERQEMLNSMKNLRGDKLLEAQRNYLSSLRSQVGDGAYKP
tara:strand:+ start:318 stop:1172 length:855 start_codon:yes stop_codon:yes gene_type:complete